MKLWDKYFKDVKGVYKNKGISTLPHIFILKIGIIKNARKRWMEESKTNTTRLSYH